MQHNINSFRKSIKSSNPKYEHKLQTMYSISLFSEISLQYMYANLD